MDKDTKYQLKELKITIDINQIGKTYFELIEEEIQDGHHLVDIDTKSINEIKKFPHYTEILEAEGEEKAEAYLDNLIQIIHNTPYTVELAFKKAIREAFLTDIETIKDKIFEHKDNEKQILEREIERYYIKCSTINDTELVYVEEFSIQTTIDRIINFIKYYGDCFNLPLPHGSIDKTDNELEHIEAAIRPIVKLWSVYYWLEDELKKLNFPNVEVQPAPLPIDKNERIKQILEPLRGAFSERGHIDTIAAGLIEYKDFGVCNLKPYRLNVSVETSEFYKPFGYIFKEIGLTPDNIGEVLTRFIFSHNGSRKENAQSNIRKLIYKYSKILETVTDSNRQ